MGKEQELRQNKRATTSNVYSDAPPSYDLTIAGAELQAHGTMEGIACSPSISQIGRLIIYSIRY